MIGVSEKNVESVFENWIDNAKSFNTRIAYRRSVKQFFEIMFNKEITEITDGDLLQLSPIMVDRQYKKYLQKAGLKDSTIMGYIKNLKAFFKQLQANKVWDSMDYTYIIESVLNFNGLKEDAGKTPIMTRSSMDRFQLWLTEERFVVGRYKHLGERYAMLSEILWVTASRITAVFNIKWIDFVYEEDARGVFGYNLYVNDKGGKENRKSISTSLYNELREMFYDGKENKQVFSCLSKQGFADCLSQFSEQMHKQFTPHSIKKGSVTEIYYLTKDLELTMRHADHNDVATTLGYIELDNDRMNTGSYILSSERIDIKSIEQLSKEQLLGIIQDREDFLRGIFHAAAQKGLLKERDGVNVNRY